MDFFKDAGYKLKSVVNAIFIVSIILHCIAAIVLLFVAISNEAFLSFLLGILILAISLFFSWLALLATAAFADLAIDASDAAANIADMKFYLQHFAKPAANTGKQEDFIHCTQCGKRIPANADFCPICGAKLS